MPALLLYREGVDYNKNNKKIMFMFALSRNKFLFCFYYTRRCFFYYFHLVVQLFWQTMRECVKCDVACLRLPWVHIGELCLWRAKTNDLGNELFKQRLAVCQRKCLTVLQVY